MHTLFYDVNTDVYTDVKGADRKLRYCIYYDNSIDKGKPVEYTSIQRCGTGVR
jgi:hypothetical protein